MANKNIYREKSVDKFNATDELDKYTKASHPSLWILLSALILIALGFLIWTFVGDVAITVNGSTSVIDNTAIIYVKSKDAEKVKPGQEVQINGSFFKVNEKDFESFQLTKELYEDNKYLAELGNFSVGDWITSVFSDVQVSNGSYKAEITIERVKPIKFIFN